MLEAVAAQGLACDLLRRRVSNHEARMGIAPHTEISDGHGASPGLAYRSSLTRVLISDTISYSLHY